MAKNFKKVDIVNPGHQLDVIEVEERDNSGVRILPYHLLNGGTHKMISCSGMFQLIPDLAEELIESTSGNTGYASSFYARKIGIPIRIYIPEGMATHKVKLLKDLGAKVVQTPRDEYTTGARNQAQAYYEQDQEKRWFLNQGKNPGNWQAHKELAYKLGGVDQLTLIGGTCGTIAGLGRGIREIHDAIITEIDLDAGPHFLNRKGLD